jgi:hypothetical protein
MRLFGEPDHTGLGRTYHSRLYVFNARTGPVKDCSTADDGINHLIGSLPNYWMETPLGRSPGRTVAAIRHSDRTR